MWLTRLKAPINQLTKLHHELLGHVAEKTTNPLEGGDSFAKMVTLPEEALVRYRVEGLVKVQQDDVHLTSSAHFLR